VCEFRSSPHEYELTPQPRGLIAAETQWRAGTPEGTPALLAWLAGVGRDIGGGRRGVAQVAEQDHRPGQQRRHHQQNDA
jgi:hypothetical protein